MDEQKQIFIFASTEIKELLIDNDTDLVELLSKAGSKVTSGFATDPTAAADSGNREPVGIILASAALALSLTPIAIRVLEELSGKKVVIEEFVWVPVEDSQGNVVYDANDQPILQRVRRAEIVESTRELRDKFKGDITGPFGWRISFKTSPAK